MWNYRVWYWIRNDQTCLYSSSSSCNCCISCRRRTMVRDDLSWFMVTLFLIFRALFAYFRVLSVSMKSRSLGDTHAIITVWLLPAKSYVLALGITLFSYINVNNKHCHKPNLFNFKMSQLEGYLMLLFWQF